MHKVILAIAAALVALLSATAFAASPDQNDVMTAVQKFADGFNSGDMNAAVSVCAPQAIIIDDTPPHAWQGATSCASWWTAQLAHSKAIGISHEALMLGQPRHVDVTADRAYVVVPATLHYTANGQSFTETGDVWIFAMQKFASGWRIVGWAWEQPEDKETPPDQPAAFPHPQPPSS